MPKYLPIFLLLLSFFSKAFAEEASHAEKAHEKEAPLFVSAEGMEDPFEDWNRSSLKMNEGLDMLIFLPVIDLYNAMTPSVVREGVTNCLQNISSPFLMVNFLLQGEGEKAGRSLGRFLINSIFGILGLFDVAAELDLPAEETTFGETIQRWGGQPGPYVVWPLLGPSCARDSCALLFGFFLSPVDMWWMWKGKYGLVDAHVALVFLETKAKYAAPLENLRETSLDYYVVLRSLYGQKQSAFLKGASNASRENTDDGPRPLASRSQLKEDDGPRPMTHSVQKKDDGPRPLASRSQSKEDDSPRPITHFAQKKDDGPRPLASRSLAAS